MATATATRRATAAPATAVVPASLTKDDLMALLGQSGEVPSGQNQFHRMTVTGGLIETDDGGMFPPRKDGPALTVRIVEPPVYYNAFFLSDRGEGGSINAEVIGRPDLNGRFVRKYDDPAAQAADTNPANEWYDAIASATGARGSFKGDMKVQIVPESGVLTGDEMIYTLSLSTTAVFEFRGSSKDPAGGTASDENFIVKLANLALEQAVEAGADEATQKVAVLNAMTSLRLGGVIADVYLPRVTSEDKSRTWTIPSFVPVHIEPVGGSGAPELQAGDVPL